ncbi:glycosyltransferase family 2 protein [Erythrobacter sp.]|uniref:glycosyltransferase family 2 protein n=1 Tax=Erythrobacter sp. TaxID=1042 RepID=UPI0025D47DC1|nr:glycosyltransferase family 2 protein [Erythrobacter sp.]
MTTSFSREEDTVLTIIPCLNEAEHIAPLLRGLLTDPVNRRIVVADGGSTDGSRAIIRQMAAQGDRIVLMDNPDGIQSAGINRAVERYGADATWIARIDAHGVYPDRYVSRLIATAQTQSVDAVVVRLETYAESGFARGVAAAQNSRLGTGGAAHRTGGAGGLVDHGHHALMRRDAFVAAGGYCENMACNEDAELDLRLLANGARIWLEPDLPVTYFPRRGLRSLLRQYFRYGAGRAATSRRHRRRLRPRQALPLAVAPACALALGAPIVPALALPALGWAGVCQAWGIALALRQRRADAAWAGSAAMIMHVGWSAGYWKQEIGALASGGRSLPGPALPFAAS